MWIFNSYTIVQFVIIFMKTFIPIILLWETSRVYFDGKFSVKFQQNISKDEKNVNLFVILGTIFGF